MIDDDLPALFKAGPGAQSALSGLVREDLDPYSVEDLQTRIVTLEDEIKRVRDVMERKKNRLSAAEALSLLKVISF